jgi:cysteinyl-tRNA synthetase
MIRATLGQQIDIHTGGIEHIPIHHNNEIAQSEAATGKKPFSRFWMHRAHIQIEGGKIAKSGGTAIYLSDVIDKGYHPLALRYLFLGAHYRTSANFTWQALEASQVAFAKLVAIGLHYKDVTPGTPPQKWKEQFTERVNDDLDTPGALAVMWEMIKDTSLRPEDLLAGLYDMDRVFGLRLANPGEAAKQLAKRELKEEVALDDLPEHIKELVHERDSARKNRSFDKADELRAEIEAQGFTVEDGDGESRVFKK